MKIYHSFNELYQSQAVVSNMAVFNKAIKGSTYLTSVRVDAETGDLIVGFTDGAICGYKVGDKGQEIMDAILAAPSRGKYFSKYVKKAYPYYKIRERSPYRKHRGIKEKVADWVWRKFK